MQISKVHRLDAEAREEHLKGELARRDQLSAQEQQIDEVDQKSLKVNNFVIAALVCNYLSQSVGHCFATIA